MKLILTKELGRLSKWLRILGIDAAYFKQENHGSLIIQALRDNRIILTRNQKLPKSGGVKIVLVRGERIKEQIQEILKKLDIKPDAETIFTRCILCNEKLTDIDKGEVKDKVPEYVFNTQKDFITCPKCRRIYWQGTHWGNVQKILNEIGY